MIVPTGGAREALGSAWQALMPEVVAKRYERLDMKTTLVCPRMIDGEYLSTECLEAICDELVGLTHNHLRASRAVHVRTALILET